MSIEATTRIEAQARRLLAAYPWPMRAEQGDEIVGTVLDALPAGVDRLPWRTAVDLVRGGLRTRRQRRPPLLTRLAYGWGRTIHPRWIWWVFDRMEDPHHRRNDALSRIGSLLVILGVNAVLQQDLGLLLVAGVLGTLAAVLGARILGEHHRNVIRARYGLVPGGSNPQVVWVRTVRRSLVPGREPRPSMRSVHRNVLRYMPPTAEVWAPESEAWALVGDRQSDPAS